jgi:SAM-dependent methyltransferase
MLRDILSRFPVVKRRLRHLRDVFMPHVSVSSHYREVKDVQVDSEAARLRSAWQANELPLRQRELVNRQLADYRNGNVVDVFDVMVKALRNLAITESSISILEVGCSSGFYSEVFVIAGLPVSYIGCDYSEAFIALARDTYPALQFDIEDATALRYTDEAFDVVISGCCLLHIPEYEDAIAETVRVAKHHAIFHRTPVVLGQPTKYFRKQAYGVEAIEIHFNESQFLALLHEYGLELVETYTLHEEYDAADPQRGNAIRTYVCRKLSK